MNSRPALSRLSGYEGLDELDVLLWDINLVFLEHVIEHHLRALFVGPCRAGSVKQNRPVSLYHEQISESAYLAVGMNNPSQT